MSVDTRKRLCLQLDVEESAVFRCGGEEVVLTHQKGGGRRLRLLIRAGSEVKVHRVRPAGGAR